MLVAYDWPVGEFGEAPAISTWLLLSGDPDREVLRGVVAKHDDIYDMGIVTLSILLPDGQEGAIGFEQWLESGQDLGIALAEDQNQKL